MADINHKGLYVCDERGEIQSANLIKNFELIFFIRNPDYKFLALE